LCLQEAPDNEFIVDENGQIPCGPAAAAAGYYGGQAPQLMYAAAGPPLAGDSHSHRGDSEHDDFSRSLCAVHSPGFKPHSARTGRTGMSAGCTTGKTVRSLPAAMDGRIVRCGIISSCQSAATSGIVKRFWSRV